MRTRKKKFPLSEKGINDAIKYLEDYKKQILEKTKVFLEELSKVGITTVDERIASAKGETTDKSHAIITDIHFDGENVRMTFEVTGEDLVFIEYGAGIYYNAGKSYAGKVFHKSQKFIDAHPDYQIGKYGTGSQKQWSLGYGEAWHYGGKITHGTEATMPVYNAQLEMSQIDEIRKAANKAFRKWV